MSTERNSDAVRQDDIHFDEGLIVNCFFEPLADIPLGVIVIDRTAHVRFFNVMAGYFLGIPPSLGLHRPIDTIMPDSKISDVLATGVTVHERQELINGRLLKCRLVPIVVRGTTLFAVEFMQDITEKTTLETQLGELRERYDMLDMLLDRSFEELGAVDRHGHLTYLTRKSARNLGVDRDEAVGRDITSLNPKCLLKKVASTGIPEVAEISRPNKKAVPVVVMPLVKDQVLQGAVCKSIFTDIKEATSFVSRLEKLQARHRPDDSPRKVSGCRFIFDDIVGNSKAILSAKERALRAAKGDSNILITGESGTGKELFAQAIHMASLRRHGPFVVVNCAGLPENLLESELFGYESGSFTGARKGGKPGKFELAHNGTIFLDETADMSMGMQAKLLRVIQEREFERIGGTETYAVDVRIIAATNRDLWEMVQRGQFREDLYYRLDVVSIRTPSLRERLEDLPLLTDYIIPQIRERANSNVTGVNREVLDLFATYDWPGNVRELRNVLESAMNLNTGELIDVQALPSTVRKKMMRAREETPKLSNQPLFAFVDRASSEKAMIEQAIKTTSGNKRQAAMMLRISRATLYNKMKKYGIVAQRCVAG